VSRKWEDRKRVKRCGDDRCKGGQQLRRVDGDGHAKVSGSKAGKGEKCRYKVRIEMDTKSLGSLEHLGEKLT